MCLIFIWWGARILWRMVSVPHPLCTDTCSFTHSFIHRSLPYIVLVLWAMLTKIVRGRLLEELQIWLLEDDGADRRTIIY